MEERHKRLLFDFLKTIDPNIVELLDFRLKEENDLDGLAFEHIWFRCKYKIKSTIIDSTTLQPKEETIEKKGLLRRHDYLAYINSKGGNKNLIWQL